MRSAEDRGASTAASVQPMHPEFPKVRCDRCRKVYTLPDDQLGAAFINGECPFCGHDRFSTVVPGTAGMVVHEAFHGRSDDAEA